MNFRNFFAEILQLFVKILLFHIIFFAKKAKIISSFASKQNAKMKRNGREIFFREKCEIFAKPFFLFAGNPKISVFTFLTRLEGWGEGAGDDVNNYFLDFISSSFLLSQYNLQ